MAFSTLSTVKLHEKKIKDPVFVGLGNATMQRIPEI